MISFSLRVISLSLRSGFQHFQIPGESEIRFCDHTPVEELLTSAGFVASGEPDCQTPWIEGEGCSPFAFGFKAQFLHIGALRTFERVGIGPAKLWAVVGQQLGDGDQGDRNFALVGQNLSFEGCMELDFPRGIAFKLCGVNGKDPRR